MVTKTKKNNKKVTKKKKKIKEIKKIDNLPFLEESILEYKDEYNMNKEQLRQLFKKPQNMHLAHIIYPVEDFKRSSDKYVELLNKKINNLEEKQNG